MYPYPIRLATDDDYRATRTHFQQMSSSPSYKLVGNRPPNFFWREVKSSFSFQELGKFYIIVFLYAFVFHLRGVVLFPFLRTLIACDPATVKSDTTKSVFPSSGSVVMPSYDHNNVKWSGSKYCNDQEYVARKAQVYKGYADALDLMLHFVTLPILGQYADKYGRRIMILVGIFGVCLQSVAYLLASLLNSVLLIFLGGALQGVTGGFFSTVHAVIADKSNDEAQRGVRTGVITLFTHALLF